MDNQILPPESNPQLIYQDVANLETTNHQAVSPIKSKIINFLKIILAFLLTATCVYFILTAPAYWAQGKYYLTHRGQQPKDALITDNQAKKVVSLDEVQNVNQDSNQPTNSQENKKLTLADLENNYLIIPKIDIKAPIVWSSPSDEEIMLENLQKGVVHYGLTPLPDSGDGPVFITGHSSYYWWDKGQYKTIFANLDVLQKDDEIALAYNDIVYVYKVYDKEVVEPDNLDVLQAMDEPVLKLMSCVPLGTNLRRLIVSARQITLDQTLPQNKKEESVPTSPSSSNNDNLNLLPWIP